MAELLASFATTIDLAANLLVIGALIALWYFRGELRAILQALPHILRRAKTLEFEVSKEKVRCFIDTMGASPELLESPVHLQGSDQATERLLELRDSYRQRLIGLTGAEGKGRQASLRKLALLALEQKKLDSNRADALVQFEDIAQCARAGLIPDTSAHAVVTVSGTLLEDHPDRPPASLPPDPR